MALPLPAASPRSRALLVTFGLATSALSSCLFGATPRQVESQSAPVRDHHLFVGVDVFMRHEKEMVAVKKIVGNDAYLDTPDHTAQPIEKMAGMQLKLATKVSDTAAVIESIDAKRAFSPGADPVMQQMIDQMQVQGALMDQAEMSEIEQRDLSNQASAAANLAINGDTPQIRAQAAAAEAELTADLNDISNDLNQLASLMDSDLFDPGSIFDDDEDAPYDAIDLSFKVSSPQPIAKAYIIALIRIDHENSLRDVSFYAHIGKVGPKPRRVSTGHVGVPPGFTIKDTKIFLFSYGEEIPTNLSEKHYQLTADEAREFAALDRQGLHRRDSVPAQPAWEFAPRELHASANPRDYDYPVTVELDASGHLVSIRENDIILPDHVRAIIENTTFLPALEKGTPVASTLSLNPIDFFKE